MILGMRWDVVSLNREEPGGAIAGATGSISRRSCAMSLSIRDSACGRLYATLLATRLNGHGPNISFKTIVRWANLKQGPEDVPSLHSIEQSVDVAVMFLVWIDKGILEGHEVEIVLLVDC
jgi:hypothetical protein